MIPYDHEIVHTNGVNLHVVQAGPEHGPLIIFLHGFPEFWYGWRKQIDYFASRGYRVWAPDQRGYNISDKPVGITAYNLNELSADVLGLINAADHENVILVGHDWGAAVAWWTACKYPQRLSKLVILNVPHHQVFRQTILRDPEQRRRSWYMGAFQIPLIPETLMGMMSSGFARGIQKSSKAGAFTDDDLLEYEKAWAQPGALKSMINWYRCIVQQPPASPESRVKVPTLMLWGKKDAYLKWEMAQASIDLCDDGKLIYFDDATHWIQHEEPDRVNALMAEFFGDIEADAEP